MSHAPALPKSETHIGINAAAALCGILAAYLMPIHAPETDLLTRTLVVVLATIIPILLIDLLWLKPGREASAGLSQQRSLSIRRVAIKYAGLVATLGFFALLFWLFPVYRDPFYSPFFAAIPWLACTMLLAAPLYFAWCDRRLDEPEDGYYHTGCAVLFRKGWQARRIGIHLRNWLVKAFFLPLMFVFLMQNVGQFSQITSIDTSNHMQVYYGLHNFIYMLDLLFACVGYIMTLRIVNSHIRSSEPTFFGWIIAVCCYSPFWNGMLYINFLAYNRDGNFDTVLAGNPIMLYATGACILVLISIYSLATIAMGYRFSNLTYRGVITSGPYRFCKHPAYVAKSLSWWLVSMPFISQNGPEFAVRSCLLLLVVNAIYFMRARTEERHLSNYPEYVTYAEAMNTRSIFAPLAKRIPVLRYTRPAHPPRID